MNAMSELQIANLGTRLWFVSLLWIVIMWVLIMEDCGLVHQTLIPSLDGSGLGKKDYVRSDVDSIHDSRVAVGVEGSTLGTRLHRSLAADPWALYI